MRNLAAIFNQITSQVSTCITLLPPAILNTDAYQLQGALVKKYNSEGAHIIVLDIHYWISRAALEIIGQAGLGYSFENLDDENATTEYARAVKDLLSVILPSILVHSDRNSSSCA